MIQSDTFPKKFRIKGNKIVFVDTNNVKEIIKQDENIETKLYEYDEFVLKLEPRKNMKQYIESNYNKLLQYAKDNPYVEEVKQTQEEKIIEQELIIEDLVQLLIDKGVVY